MKMQLLRFEVPGVVLQEPKPRQTRGRKPPRKFKTSTFPSPTLPSTDSGLGTNSGEGVWWACWCAVFQSPLTATRSLEPAAALRIEWVASEHHRIPCLVRQPPSQSFETISLECPNRAMHRADTLLGNRVRTIFTWNHSR